MTSTKNVEIMEKIQPESSLVKLPVTWLRAPNAGVSRQGSRDEQEKGELHPWSVPHDVRLDFLRATSDKPHSLPSPRTGLTTHAPTTLHTLHQSHRRHPARAERLALADFGRAWKRFERRKNLKREKCYSKPQTPKNPLHALFGGSTP